MELFIVWAYKGIKPRIKTRWNNNAMLLQHTEIYCEVGDSN